MNAGRVLHTLRSAYGYTDEQIFDNIREYGQAWIDESINLINEDKKQEMEWQVETLKVLVQIAPVARTPMDKKSGTSLQNYTRRLIKELDLLLPWKAKEKHDAIKERLKKPPQEKMWVEE